MDGFRRFIAKHFPDMDDQVQVMDEWIRWRSHEGTWASDLCKNSMKKLPGHKFWRAWGAMTPLLQKLSIKCLGQVISSSSCERVNSECDYIKSKKGLGCLTLHMNNMFMCITIFVCLGT